MSAESLPLSPPSGASPDGPSISPHQPQPMTFILHEMPCMPAVGAEVDM